MYDMYKKWATETQYWSIHIPMNIFMIWINIFYPQSEYVYISISYYINTHSEVVTARNLNLVHSKQRIEEYVDADSTCPWVTPNLNNPTECQTNSKSTENKFNYIFKNNISNWLQREVDIYLCDKR